MVGDGDGRCPLTTDGNGERDNAHNVSFLLYQHCCRFNDFFSVPDVYKCYNDHTLSEISYLSVTVSSSYPTRLLICVHLIVFVCCSLRVVGWASTFCYYK